MTELVKVESVLTTTHPIGAYGGIKLALPILEQLAEGIRDGTLPMTFNHDPTNPMEILNVTSGVRQRSDGYYEAWAEYDVPIQQWEMMQAAFNEAGVSGGMSFSLGVADGVVRSESTGAGTVHFAADAHHFEPAERRRVALNLAELADVEVKRLYQFGFVPDAIMIIGASVAFFEGVPAGILSNYLYSALRSAMRSGQPTIFDFKLTSGAEGQQTVNLRIQTEDPEVLKTALYKLPEILSEAKNSRFDGASKEWKQVE